MIDIIIPTLKTAFEIAPLVCELEGFIDLDKFRVITTCLKRSASVNRNEGLKRAQSDIVIMLDDDISGFHYHWAEGMISPLDDPSIIMVSARLFSPDGGLGYSMSLEDDLSPGIIKIHNKKAPTCCIAFRRDGTMFDERFVGSGFEDTWFCVCLNKKYPHGRYVINNDVKLVHANEKKNQDIVWERNKETFTKLKNGELI